jgi:hypothetical protein
VGVSTNMSTERSAGIAVQVALDRPGVINGTGDTEVRYGLERGTAVGGDCGLVMDARREGLCRWGLDGG